VVVVRPKKVLHVLNSAGGGAALSALALAKGLAAEGIASCAVCHDAGSPEEREAVVEAFGGEVLFTRLYWWNRKNRMPLWRRPLAELKQILITGWSLRSTGLLTERAARWNADLIHTNTILTPEGGLAARRLGLPHVWHLRELLGPGGPFRLAREGQAFGRYMSNYCSKLIANSEASAARIRDWVAGELLEVVPNGIDISHFHPGSHKSDNGKFIVGMVGNLTSRSKKHALLIEAAAKVDRSLPIEWRIYGHDPSRGGAVRADAYTNELHDLLTRFGLSDRFTWPGFFADPAEIMSQIDLLVHPADNESFGRVVVEAMAAELPAVGVRGGGVAEIIRDGETVLLARPDDPRDLAENIEQLARDRQRSRRLGRAGRQRAESHYSLAANIKGTLAVYEQAMARPLRSSSPARNLQTCETPRS
jgi:glycosyltransferase involved in cell wall biosynthesis